LKIKTFLQFAKKFIAEFSLFVAYCSISPLAFGVQSGKMSLQHFKYERKRLNNPGGSE